MKGQVAAIIRPDLILTDDGFALSELDSVPGGIGLTAWLAETYSALCDPVLGGADGMRTGFASVLPEARRAHLRGKRPTYRPEMEWLLGPARVKSVEDYAPNDKPAYRFFEAFDYPKLEKFRAGWRPGQPLTPPLKPYLEEKLWLALFWSRTLQEFWRQEIGEKGQKLLQSIIPYSWVLDPAPLPVHAVIPELNIQSWAEMDKFSQKQRDLVLKISGFSELAWGSRGVQVGSDMPAEEWSAQVRLGLEEFTTHPRLLMRFAKGALAKQDYAAENDENRDAQRPRAGVSLLLCRERPRLARRRARHAGTGGQEIDPRHARRDHQPGDVGRGFDGINMINRMGRRSHLNFSPITLILLIPSE